MTCESDNDSMSEVRGFRNFGLRTSNLVSRQSRLQASPFQPTYYPSAHTTHAMYDGARIHGVGNCEARIQLSWRPIAVPIFLITIEAGLLPI